MKTAIAFYYIYLMFILAGTCYLVFYVHISAWWWVLTIGLTYIRPELTTKDETETTD